MRAPRDTYIRKDLVKWPARLLRFRAGMTAGPKAPSRSSTLIMYISGVAKYLFGVYFTPDEGLTIRHALTLP